MGKLHRYSEEENKFLRENINGRSLKELTTLFDARFGLGIKEKTLRCHCERLKIFSDRKHIYSKEEVEFIRARASSISRKELAACFNSTFNTNISCDSLANFARRNELTPRIKEPYRYTEEEIIFLRDNVKGRTFDDLTLIFNERFGHSFNAQRIQAYCHRIGLHNDYFGRHLYSEEERKYVCAHADQFDSYTAKDLKRIFGTNRSPASIARKRYENGILCPHRNRTDWCAAPLGSESRRRKQAPQVKVSLARTKHGDRSNWVSKDRLVWEKYTGNPVPKDYVVHHLDLDPMNCAIENLMIVPKKYRAIFAGNDWWSAPPEIKKVALRWCDYYYKVKEYTDENP